MIKKKKPANSRKEPRQARAKATFDAILEATAHILVEDGYERLTTNHVAARAGVSIGSVYMYFRTKEAIVASLVDRHIERFGAVIGSEAIEALRMPLASGVERIIGAIVRANASVEPNLHRALEEGVRRVAAFEKIRALDRSFETLLAASLDARADDHTSTDTKLAAFMVVQACKAITLEATREHPDALQDGRLARELARMVVRYLTDSRPSPGTT
jgi:AcrR family transcriptional regulator